MSHSPIPSTPVKSSLLLLFSLFLLAHGLHGGEEQHVADGGAVGHQHSAFGAGWESFEPELTSAITVRFKT